jgi:predicted molibdopterin-dependent oxidoreductase YjgC
MLASELALRLGTDLGFTSAGEVLAEIGRIAPSHLGLTVEVVNATPDGVLLPLPAEAEAEPVAAAVDADQAGGDADAAAVRAAASDDADVIEAETAAATEAEGEATADPEGDAAVPAEQPPANPELVTFAVSAPGPVPPLDAYAFRLVATRKLYDQGTLVQASAQLSGLAPGTTARVNPYDADRLGVTAGDRVVLRSARTSLTLPVHPDAGVPRGAVALVLNQADARVGDLIAVDGPVTELHIETAS